MTVAEFLSRLLVEPGTVVTVRLIGTDRETMREYKVDQNVPSWMYLIGVGFVEIRGKQIVITSYSKFLAGAE